MEVRKEKKKYGTVLKCLGILLVVLVLGFCLLYRFPTDISAEAYSDELAEQFPEAAELLEDYQGEGRGVQFGTVIVVTRQSVLRGTKTELYLPCCTRNIVKVATAGTSQWVFSYRVLSNVEHGILRLEDATVTFTPGENTWLNEAGAVSGCEAAAEGEDERTLSFQFASALGEPAVVTCNAATTNSDKEKNVETKASVCWKVNYRIGLKQMESETTYTFPYVTNGSSSG